MGKFAKSAKTAERVKRRCIVARALAEFDPEDVAAFEHYAKTRQWSVIYAADFPAGEMAIRRHVAGTCSCSEGEPALGIM